MCAAQTSSRLTAVAGHTQLGAAEGDSYPRRVRVVQGRDAKRRSCLIVEPSGLVANEGLARTGYAERW